ncbi:MAG: hypothetical protein EBS90_13465, partial [Betaproteobacteria bacterium]|nr:hypothetical protein [Betaproteobacteria bacterium]
MKRRASFVIFDTRCEDVANFVMAILQAMSPESQLVVEECGFGPVKPSLAFQRGPPLTMTVLAFCGSAASIKRAVIMTLEKASTTTLDFDKSNPSDKTAWKGITLRTIWSIVRSQNSLFPMAYEEFLSIDQHQRADQVMTALSPDSMRAQTLNFYNLGTSDIRLCLPDFPLAFGPDLLSLEKMRYIAYAFIPSCSEVHQSIFSLIRPAVHISSSSASYQMISLSLMCSDKMLVKLLTWAYKQIYDLPDTVLSDRKKHEMCVSITKQECQSSGDGMNPVVASFMGSIDAINREIDGLETCSDFVNEICAMATDRSESSMLFIDVTERLLRKVGFQVNVSIFASLIAICC